MWHCGGSGGRPDAPRAPPASHAEYPLRKATPWDFEPSGWHQARDADAGRGGDADAGREGDADAGHPVRDVGAAYYAWAGCAGRER